MCTVSIVCEGGLTRLVCNRDERRDRPAARPPHVRTRAGVRALFPVDPVGEGTWVGCNDAGLVLALLNVSGGARVTEVRRSRGDIIPSLLHHRRLADAMQAARSMDVEQFAPFRLIALQGDTVATSCSESRLADARLQTLEEPLLWTSSTLGDALVDAPRRQLFQTLLRASPSRLLTGQAAFHRHRWKHAPEISVAMARTDACTVSRTTIDVAGAAMRMVYEPLDRQSPLALYELSAAA